eukprot:4464269-Pyramimonas_sp.AAC.1
MLKPFGLKDRQVSAPCSRVGTEHLLLLFQTIIHSTMANIFVFATASALSSLAGAEMQLMQMSAFGLN